MRACGRAEEGLPRRRCIHLERGYLSFLCSSCFCRALSRPCWPCRPAASSARFSPVAPEPEPLPVVPADDPPVPMLLLDWPLPAEEPPVPMLLLLDEEPEPEPLPAAEPPVPSVVLD